MSAANPPKGSHLDAESTPAISKCIPVVPCFPPRLSFPFTHTHLKSYHQEMLYQVELEAVMINQEWSAVRARRKDHQVECTAAQSVTTIFMQCVLNP